MLAFLTRFLGSGIAGELRRAYEARLAAANDKERIEADKTIAQLEARQAVLIAGGRITAFVQAAFAAPFCIYIWKLVVFDKVLAMGATDDLSPALWQVCMLILGFYFAGAMIRGVLR